MDAGGRISRRVDAVVAELGRHGVRVRPAADAASGSLVVAAHGGRVDGAHLVVHAGPDADTDSIAEWVAALPRPGAGDGAVSAAPDPVAL